MIRLRQKLWNEAVERRVSETTEVLGMIRGGKLTGMIEYLFQRIQQLRVDELEICKGFRRLQVFKNVLGKKNLPTKYVDLVIVLIAYNYSQFIESCSARTYLCRGVRHETPPK